MAQSTYKDIFRLVREQIDSRVNYRNNVTFRNQLDTTQLNTPLPNSLSDISSGNLISSIQSVLQEALPGYILSGLEVEATDPVSSSVIVKAGKGSKGGFVYELKEDIVVPVPEDDTEVFIVSLYRNHIIIDKEAKTSALPLAKIIVPQPNKPFQIYDKKIDREDDWDAYIVTFQEAKLYTDRFGNLEEESIAFLRANIGPVLADNIIGNIKLSEDLTISNTQGTITLDSSALKLYNSSGNLLAKFNENGTFYYNSSGVEIARFATDSAKIGNILITKNSVQSGDFISENRGFRIEDSGYAEFQDVRVRGRISSSVFEHDKISSVGGKLYVGNSSVLSANMTALDSCNLEVDDAVFAVGDVITIKDGTNQEYLLVTSISSAPIYSVTRDIANVFSANSNPAWNKGTAVVSTGNGNSGSLSGYILMDAVSSYAPFMDVVSRNSTSYNDYTVKARVGNLSGITDSLYGVLSGYGLYSDNVFLKGKLYAPDIKTAISGKRLELSEDGLFAYDASNNIIFSALLNSLSAYGDENDITIGDINTNNYVRWDNSAGTLTVRGNITVDSLETNSLGVGSRVIINDDELTAYNNDSGAGNPVFKVFLSGANVGDVVFGNSSDITNLVKWDDSTGILSIRGTLNADDITAGSIDASAISVINISASNINTGTLDASGITVTNLSASSITTGSLSGINISIGSSNSIFKADSNGIYLGNATYASAPFRVAMDGSLVATSASITGAIDANSGTIGALTVDGTLSIGTGGLIQSSDYSAGTTGFKLSPTGGLEVNTGTIKGNTIDENFGTLFAVSSVKTVDKVAQYFGSVGISATSTWEVIYRCYVDIPSYTTTLRLKAHVEVASGSGNLQVRMVNGAHTSSAQTRTTTGWFTDVTLSSFGSGTQLVEIEGLRASGTGSAAITSLNLIGEY